MRYVLAVLFSLTSGFALADPIYELPVISTTAQSPTAPTLNSSLGNQTIINVPLLYAMGVHSLPELLNHVSGLRYDDGVGANPTLFIRNKPALVLINGIPLTHFSSAAPPLNLINLADVEKIVITPGSAGVAYGDQAQGGVVDIITQDSKETNVTVDTTLGLPQSEQLDFEAHTALSPTVSANFNGNLQHDLGYRDYSTTSQGGFGGGFSQQDDQGQLQWQFQVARQILQYPGALTAEQVAQDPTQSIPELQGNYSDNTLANFLTWKRSLNNQWTSQLSFSQNQSWGLFTYPASLIQDSTQMMQSFLLDEQLSRTATLFDLPDEFKMGAMAGLDNYSFTQYISESTRHQGGLYTQNTLQLPDNWTLSAGARGVWIDTEGQFYSFSTYPSTLEQNAHQIQHLFLTTVEMSKQISSSVSAYIRRANSYALPFIDQSNYSPIAGGFGLNAETDTSYETGFTFKTEKWKGSLEGYVMNVKNEIAYVDDPALGYSFNVNLPPTRHIGLIGTLNHSLTDKLQVGAQLTASRQWFQQGPYVGKSLPDAPNWLSEINDLYQISERWSWLNELQYTGSQFADGDFDNTQGTVSGYTLFNTALSYSVQEWVASFRINNLTNRQYNLYTVFVPTQIDYYPAPGRVFLLNLRYRFGNS